VGGEIFRRGVRRALLKMRDVMRRGREAGVGGGGGGRGVPIPSLSGKRICAA